MTPADSVSELAGEVALCRYSPFSGQASDRHMPLVIRNLKAGVSRDTPLDQLPQLMTEAEVADYLALSLTQVTRMRYEKRGPKTIRLGHKERIKREDLIAWIDERAAK